jgi:hypothetical protein
MLLNYRFYMIVKKIKIAAKFLLLAIVLLLSSCKKGKGAICNDGWRSYSTGSGTCSWHGGIDHYIDPNETDGFKTTLLVVSIVGGLVVLRFINRN